MKWVDYYDRNTILFFVSLYTCYGLVINDVSTPIFIIGIADLIDILVGIRTEYCVHHVSTVSGWIYWHTLNCSDREILLPIAWYLLLHEVSNIPLSLIYVLKPYSFYNKIEYYLKVWFALTFLCFRSYSIIFTYLYIETHKIILYPMIITFTLLDILWGKQIIRKIFKYKIF